MIFDLDFGWGHEPDKTWPQAGKWENTSRKCGTSVDGGATFGGCQRDDSDSEDEADDEVVVRVPPNMSPLSDTVVGTSQGFICSRCLCLHCSCNPLKYPRQQMRHIHWFDSLLWL